MRKLVFISLLMFFVGCEQKSVYQYKATEECNNLKFSVGRLFPKETIYLYYNNKSILQYKVDSLDGFRFERDFCIDYKENGMLKVVSVYNDKTYIDTAINIKKERFGYLLTVSLPHPKDWRRYYEDNSPVPTKEWGYLPIDSCVRLVSLNPDTILKNTWTDEVHGLRPPPSLALINPIKNQGVLKVY